MARATTQRHNEQRRASKRKRKFLTVNRESGMTGTTDSRTIPLQLRILGTFRLERGGRTLRLPTHRAECLLAYLFLHPESHLRERLAGLFWADVTDQPARHSPRTALAT